ncbi:Serine/threonine-protein kinase PrkC [Luteitalea pratensis]|uniref:Serine/threonine-protein kinase PrkC n=1 Tax=Luteitalea pratensis TaxID=1855912 RepID=A0A143PMF2_LUTPR|nr:Serine/threonine-protein kinase PrkC [Luteitalea pratensis]
MFALGIVLFEMTTGRKPFGGDSRASMMAAILTDEPPLISSLRADTPANLDRIVNKCLAKSPDQRWQSARDLAAALQWSTDDTAAHVPVSRAAWRHQGVRRTAAGVALGLAAVAAAVWIACTTSRPASTAPAPSPRFVQLTFRTGTVSAARFAPGGDTIVYSAAWGMNPYALFMTRAGSPESEALNVRDAKLLGVSTAGDIAFLRGNHATLKLLAPTGYGTLARVSMTGGGPRELLDDVIAADWNPGSADVAVVGRGQVDFPLGTRIHGAHAFSAVRVSPDGQRLALVEGPDIVVLDRAGRKTTLSSGWASSMASLAWSASGNEVWFTVNRPAPNSDLTTWALRAVSLEGKERVILPARGVALSILDVSRDGRVLMVSQYAKMGCTCQGPGDARPRDFSWLDGTAPEALSRDGRQVVFAEMLRGGGPGRGDHRRSREQERHVRRRSAHRGCGAPRGR